MAVDQQTPRTLFIDDTGGTALDHRKSDHVGRHFVVAAAIEPSSRLEERRATLETVRRRYFQTGEMKSVGIANNTTRRLVVLRALAAADLRAYVFSVDKDAVDPESGLIYKQSFIKHIHKRILTDLLRAIGVERVIVDEHGSPEFMQGFQAYLSARFKQPLFPAVEFQMLASRDDVYLQAIDIVAGSIARVLDGKEGDRAQEVLDALQPVMKPGFREWPVRYSKVEQLVDEDADTDPVIARAALAAAKDYIEGNRGTRDTDALLRREAINHLFFQYTQLDAKAWVSTRSLVDTLRDRSAVDVSERGFRRVVSGLRDARLLIASGSKGYKLPRNQQELRSFVRHANTVIQPLLARVARAREVVQLATQGEHDLLEGDEFRELRRLLDARGTGPAPPATDPEAGKVGGPAHG
jgi:hypothetical protein